MGLFSNIYSMVSNNYRLCNNALFHCREHILYVVPILNSNPLYKFIAVLVIFWFVTYFDLSDRLRTRGWQAPAYSLPVNLTDVVVMRLLIRHGVSRDLGDLFVEDVKRSLEYFKNHRIVDSITENEGGGFHH